MSRRLIAVTCCLSLCWAISACGEDGKENLYAPDGGQGAHAHSHDGQHGGHILELGAVGHLEYVHDSATGTASLYFTGPELKAALIPTKGPELKLSTDAGQVVVPMAAMDGVPGAYTATHEALKAGHPVGRISVTVGGKDFNPDLEAAHGH